MTSAAPPQPADAPASERRWTLRGRRRASNLGMAIVARGEPMVWLTGGALVLTIFMIAGLLLLIVSQGMGTFWPQPIVELRLLDGAAAVGEITRTDAYSLSPAAIAALPGPQRAALGGSGKTTVESRRRLVRTGNFELTGEHFRWVSDFEIAADGESTPEWAVVLERVAWGRFYGLPEAFVIRHPRPVSGDEEQLARIVAFLESNVARLPEADQTSVSEALEPLRGQLAEIRRRSAATLLSKLRADPGTRRIEVVLESGETVPAETAPADVPVVEVREAWSGREAVWALYERHHPEARARFARQHGLEENEMGRANGALERARLALKRQELQLGMSLLPRADQLKAIDGELAALALAADEASQVARQIERRFAGDAALVAAGRAIARQIADEVDAATADPVARREELTRPMETWPDRGRSAVEEYLSVQEASSREEQRIVAEIESLKRENARLELHLKTSTGEAPALLLADIVRGYPANRLTLGGKWGVYFSRWWEFLADEPREANSEGGVMPAIAGTVTMTLIMALAVVPFGVLAALYLREYARGGLVVSIVRISVNNLAGVPSIVFGVFGLGFFCYIVGAYIDGGPERAGFAPWPRPTWFVAVGALAATAVGAFACGMLAIASRRAEASPFKRWMGRGALALWIAATALLVVSIARTPLFGGYFPESLPNPTYGKGGLIWASLTLALMTLPVVIVATEEALAAVPNSMREGSYACGASKWQTIERIVLPRALPGIMTGMILAMARGAGEVAPLMLVGAVKLAPQLPVDATAPFIHPERSFMHLGFHIYDLGFQSQNSEAAKPMVFTTTLLLIALIAGLNLSAVWLRGRLRRRYRTAQF